MASRVRLVRIFWDRLLGKGGEGTVFLGKDAVTGVPLAVKVYGQPGAPLPLFYREQVKLELRRGLKVKGERVLKPVAWKIQASRPWIAFPLAELGSLRTILTDLAKRRRRYKPRRVLEIILDCLRGVEESHVSGLIHRDIKPDNLLGFADGSVLLSDWGLGRTLTRPCWNQTRAQLGTAPYWSPEQKNRECVDQRSDIYSIGAVFYELLTGKVPTHQRPLRPPSELREGLSSSIDRLVMSMLEIDPGRRLQSATSARRRVEALLSRLKLHAALATLAKLRAKARNTARVGRVLRLGTPNRQQGRRKLVVKPGLWLAAPQG